MIAWGLLVCFVLRPVKFLEALHLEVHRWLADLDSMVHSPDRKLHSIEGTVLLPHQMVHRGPKILCLPVWDFPGQVLFRRHPQIIHSRWEFCKVHPIIFSMVPGKNLQTRLEEKSHPAQQEYMKSLEFSEQSALVLSIVA